LADRGISQEKVIEILHSNRPFKYLHEGLWKDGYYDAPSRIFIGVWRNTIITIINNVSPQYIASLKKGSN
jgi:hypothetical protein